MDGRPAPPAMLASDAERDHAIGVLRDAVAEGRLTLEEFSDRVGQVQVARTDRDLAAVRADLPAVPAPPGAPRLTIRVSGPGGTLYVRSARGRAVSRRAIRRAGSP